MHFILFFFKVLINSEIKWPHKHDNIIYLTLQLKLFTLWELCDPQEGSSSQASLLYRRKNGWGGEEGGEKSTIGKEKGFRVLLFPIDPSLLPTLAFQDLPLKLLPGPIPSLLPPNDYVCLESTVQYWMPQMRIKVLRIKTASNQITI